MPLRTKRRSQNSMDVQIQMENLPGDVIHHIMALLPTSDAAKFSVLSKSLRSSWLSFPVLDFDFGFFRDKKVGFSGNSYVYSSSADKCTRFLSFIEHSMKVRRPHLQSSLQKLRFRFNGLRSDTKVSFEFLLDKLVEFALENNVKELELDLNTIFLKSYFIDQRVFSLKSLKILRLEGIHLGVQDLILTCPSLEFISIIACSGFEKIRVFSSIQKLRVIDIKRCRTVKGIQVQAENLESFLFCQDRFVRPHCEIDISACQFLRKLSLKNFDVSDQFFEQAIRFYYLEFLYLTDCKVPRTLHILNPELRTLMIKDCKKVESLVISSHHLTSLVLGGLVIITDQWVKDNMSALSLLENLELSCCNLLQNIDFIHKNLKKFKLENCAKLKKAEIDARNMLSFSYCGSQSVDPLLITSAKCDTRILLKAEAKLSAQWFVQLRNFLKYFDHHKSLTLGCSSSEELIFPTEFTLENYSPLNDMKHLTVELVKFSESNADLIQLLESLLWLAPRPEKINLVWHSQKHTIEFCYSNQGKRMQLNCCSMLDFKCWRHQTGKVVIENFQAFQTHCLKEFFAGYI